MPRGSARAVASPPAPLPLTRVARARAQTALYTARLTTALVVDEQFSYKASSIDTLDPAENLCMLGGIKDMMTKRYPQNSIMPKATEDSMYKDPKVETGLSDDCDALAVSLRANTYLEPHCSELGISNANIFTLPLGQPAAPELAQIFSYWLAQMNEEGSTPGGDVPDACSMYTEDGSEGQRAKIGFKEILPLLAICAAAWGWALIEYWLRLRLKGETMMRHEYLKTTHEQEARDFPIRRKARGWSSSINGPGVAEA